MRRTAAALFLSTLLSGVAEAQPAPDKKIETVIVTAPKFHAGVTPNAIAHDFVKSFAAPTMLRDAIARWQVAICPEFKGLAPQYAAVMQARFLTIAGEAGAPVQAKGCKPNLSVVFTPQPQAYLDAIHEKNMDVVGYHGTTKVSHAIQAWYVTGIRDIRGVTVVDHDVMQASLSCTKPGTSCWTLPIMAVGGWRDHPDLSSDLLTPNCDDKLKPSEITPTDIAYLRGVYKMDAGAKLQIQQDQIAAEMAAALGGGK